MQSTECKYCGCEEVATKTDSEIVFRCWSSYVVEDDHWTVSNNCGARCVVQLMELKGRVQRAIDTLKKAKRYTVTPVSRNALTWDTDPDGYVTDSTAVDEAIAILEGERE